MKSYREVLSAVIVFFCLNLVMFTHLPVTADRSITVFLLGYMTKVNRTLTADELHQALFATYVDEHKALEKRVNEQIQSGTMKQDDEGLTITPAGRLLMQMYRWIADLFGIDKRNLFL